MNQSIKVFSKYKQNLKDKVSQAHLINKIYALNFHISLNFQIFSHSLIEFLTYSFYLFWLLTKSKSTDALGRVKSLWNMVSIWIRRRFLRRYIIRRMNSWSFKQYLTWIFFVAWSKLLEYKPTGLLTHFLIPRSSRG